MHLACHTPVSSEFFYPRQLDESILYFRNVFFIILIGTADANSEGPDFAASGLDLHCLPMSF